MYTVHHYIDDIYLLYVLDYVEALKLFNALIDLYYNNLNIRFTLVYFGIK